MQYINKETGLVISQETVDHIRSIQCPKVKVATIDATIYPVVRVESKERVAVPSLALRVLEFDPVVTSNRNFKHDFLIYFMEEER